MSGKRISRVVLVVLIGWLVAAPSRGSSIQLHQMDFNLNGNVYTDTEWGGVDLSFTGTSAPKYFNLAVNGNWVVQEMPVLSVFGDGQPNTLRYYFDLGVPRGTPVSSVNYAYTVTDLPLGAMPAGTTPGSVLNDDYEFYNGLIANPISGVLPAARNLIGGLIDSLVRVYVGFPHLEQGKNECTPTALLQSLTWLKEKKNLPIPESSLTIDWLKSKIGWTSNGCGDDWPTLKRDATAPYGVTTEVLDFRTATVAERRAYMERLLTEMGDNQDIELDITGHTTTLVGLLRLAGGRWVVATVDDKAQGRAGGRVVAIDIFDPADRSLWNVPLIGGGFANSVLDRAIIECPEPGGLAVSLVFGFALRRRRLD